MLRCVDQPCIIETRGTLSKKGYRRIGAKKVAAHRLAWEQANGRALLPAPAETVDHICHNEDPSCPGGPSCLHRQCIEPTHLVVRTAVENWREGRLGIPSIRAALTHCPAGHPYDEANTYIYRGWRQCRACHAQRERQRKTARHQATS